uniref:Transposase (putative) gypsy type domain-containing protein n=1 Tax=Fagus sylvatica TaxID=28930 RepID=A0A2N9J2C0_FAGSY
MLHRLSAELYSLSFPTIRTWGVIRQSMAAEGSDWPDRLGSMYQILEDVVLRIPNLDESACSPEEDVAFYESALTASLRFPVQPFIRELLDFLSLVPGQIAPNGWRVIISSMVMWRESSDGLDDVTVEEFLYCFEPTQIATSPDFWTFRNREVSMRLMDGLPSSNRALTRPTLTQVWKDRVLRVHHLSNRQYTYYIQPDLLFCHSFGPEPNDAVLTLIQTNEKRAAAMKINKSKLKSMVEKGGPVVPVGIKRKRVNERQPSIISEPSATDDGPTICRSHGLAAKRAEAAITELNFQEYANAQTENISKLMVHSLMRRLAESEASQKNLNRAIFELNKEKRDLIGAVEAAKVKLLAKDGDLKAAVDARDKAYRKKQAREKYPDIDFAEFQPYDDTDSMNDDGGRGAEGDQTDDATS